MLPALIVGSAALLNLIAPTAAHNSPSSDVTICAALPADLLLAAIVESSDDAIISKDLTGTITSWNQSAERIFGYTASEIVGQSVLRLIAPELQGEEPKILARVQNGERIDHYETVRMHKSGRRIHVSLTISPIKDDAGRVVGVSKVARDISDKKAVAQLALANEELRRAERMKSEFVAIMSHELRTPLNSILGFTSVIRQGRSGPLTDVQKMQLNLIHASGKHLLHVINDLLDLSRIEAGWLELECEDFSPAEVIQEAIRTLELQAQQKNLQMRSSVDTAGAVHSDRKRFFQVVLNLLSNAIKFTPQGRIDVRAFREDEKLVVSVADTGIGIPKETQGTLFNAFTQLEGTARRCYEGTGLGLYLCRKIVTLLGGEIAVASEANRGSVFTFWILAHHDAGAPPPDQQAALP